MKVSNKLILACCLFFIWAVTRLYVPSPLPIRLSGNVKNFNSLSLSECGLSTSILTAIQKMRVVYYDFFFQNLLSVSSCRLGIF